MDYKVPDPNPNVNLTLVHCVIVKFRLFLFIMHAHCVRRWHISRKTEKKELERLLVSQRHTRILHTGRPHIETLFIRELSCYSKIYKGS